MFSCRRRHLGRAAAGLPLDEGTNGSREARRSLTGAVRPPEPALKGGRGPVGGSEGKGGAGVDCDGDGDGAAVKETTGGVPSTTNDRESLTSSPVTRTSNL